MIYRFLLLVLLLCLTACSAQSPRDETATSAPPSATAMPESPPGAGDTPAAVGSPSSVIGDAGVADGRNDDGTFFHGAADAPVTLIDYSDFL